MNPYGGEGSNEPKAPVWLTRDQCVTRYNFDPTGYPEDALKSKLVDVKRKPQRVWLEDAIKAKVEELKGTWRPTGRTL
jgi:hypothetical protein